MENEYIHGSDMLVGLMMQDKYVPFGHSKTCTISNKADTKERSVKPTIEDKAKAGAAGKWKEKQYHAAKRSDRKDKRITAKRRKESETGGKLNASSARKISSPYRYKARPSEGHAAAKVRRDSLLRSRKVV